MILLFNEGEELGLVGARAFLADPLSRNVDSLHQPRGARSARAGQHVRDQPAERRAGRSCSHAPRRHPVANSLSTDVYRLMPNYTDVNSFDERGWLTLNIAPIGNETRYHSPGDDLAALDPGRSSTWATRHWRSPKRWLPDLRREETATDFMDLSGRTLIALPIAAGAALLAPPACVRLADRVAARRDRPSCRSSSPARRCCRGGGLGPRSP